MSRDESVLNICRHMLWRTGRKIHRNIYAMPLGKPSDDDIDIGRMDTDVLAYEAVDSHNALLDREKATLVQDKPG